MSSWWTKLAAAFRGSDQDPADLSASADDADGPAAPEARDPPVSDAPPADAGDQTLLEVRDAVSALKEAVERDLTPLTAESARVAEVLARLEAVVAAVSEKADANAGGIGQLQEAVASLPEFASAQVESISNLEQRIDGFEGRTAATSDAVAAAARDLDELKSLLAQLDRTIQEGRASNADVAAQQEQVVRALAELRQLVNRNVEIAAAGADATKTLAEARTNRSEQFRRHVTRECERLAKKTVAALVLAAIAAVAAIAAAVIATLK
jgi:chromosome segregation ATPase